MLSTTIFGLALAGLSTAQSTVSLFIPGADEMPLVASIIASDSTATTYAVQCPSGTDASDCGIADGLILTQGPKTFAYSQSLPYEYGSATVVGYAFSVSMECSLDGTSTAVCVESIGGDEANFPGVSTGTLTGPSLFFAASLTTSSLTVPGANAAATTTSAVPASTTGTGAGASKTTESSSRSSTGSESRSSTGSESSEPTSSPTGAAAASSSTSTGGLAMVTGHAQWVVGGAALAAVLL